jgi:uncharacterized protein
MALLYEADTLMYVWWGTRIECASAIARLLREGRLVAETAASIRDHAATMFRTAEQIVPTEDLQLLAERVLAVHPLRAADALQLAAALVWSRERPAGHPFMCLDARLRLAAQREGFTVLPAAL